MKLVRFQVRNFRSVGDSGPIEVHDRTTLVGRNESGKSNLLLALVSLNPAGRMKEHTFAKDFPRDRPKAAFSDTLPVVTSTWELTPIEKDELTRVFPRAMSVTKVEVGRSYHTTRNVEFLDLDPVQVDESLVSDHQTRLSQSVNGSLRGRDEQTVGAVKDALALLNSYLIAPSIPIADHTNWATDASSAMDTFISSLQSLGIAVTDRATIHLEAIRQHLESLVNDRKSLEQAQAWVLKQLPTFIYLSDYPELEGHQNIPEFLDRKEQDQLTDADEFFEKLVKVAELEPAELHTLLQQSHEERQLLTNRAGATLTRNLRDLWTDRALKVRFSLDADHFDTLISDPNAFYDVEVNLDERSRGLKWFFSFYIAFAADTRGGPAENAILLLDEPGLHLHATAQRDLLTYFKRHFSNTIIYTTHSPFMIPADDIPSIRTVNIDQDQGTTVTNDPTGDYRTLFPLQAALSYDLTQTMFVGNTNLVVEGVSDYWYLSAMMEYLQEIEGISLPKGLVITPSGGAQKVSYMATLLSSQRLNVLVLLDYETNARRSANEMVEENLIRHESIIFVNDGNPSSNVRELDIEDLIDPDVYAVLVSESYSAELTNRELVLNPHIPRIVSRYTAAFREVGIEFRKTRPARLFLRRIAQDADFVTPTTKQNFEALFTVINERLETLVSGRNDPFP